MKQIVFDAVSRAIAGLKSEGVLNTELKPKIQIERCRDPKHGDFACNIAMMLAKPAGLNPRELAEKIKTSITTDNDIQAVEIAGPGFINFRLKPEIFQAIVAKVLTAGEQYGQTDIGHNKRVHLEYVSANPTGPLHVGHGRGAAYGACVANLLKAAGFNVHQEYYVNDAGRQMKILALSIWLRYLEILGEEIVIPAGAYQGDYIIDIANTLNIQHQVKFKTDYPAFLANIPAAKDNKDDTYIDNAVICLQNMIGEANFEIIRQLGIEAIVADIRDDLTEFGVQFDKWFKESKLFDEGLLTQGIELLREHGYVYEKDGATWFRATELDDEKDRVLIRANGISTYFASDVAYHLYKYQQGYDQIIDIFGADHHGYISRIRSFLRGLGQDPDKLKILLVQFAILYRGDEKVSMSTRKGEFVTLRELRQEVGNDAARFFYIMRKPEQHLDFDLELAKSQSNENPVYYIQYAHARICSVWQQLEKNALHWDQAQGLTQLNLLSMDHEKQLLDRLWQYPELISSAATQCEPHLVAHFLQELANQFHAYYNASKFLVEDEKLRNARLSLIAAVQQVIKNGLGLLGVSALDKM